MILMFFCVFFFPDVFDSGRRDKPSVLVTSPGSPELHIPHRSARPPRLGSSPTISNVGGRLQVSLTRNNSENAFKNRMNKLSLSKISHCSVSLIEHY